MNALKQIGLRAADFTLLKKGLDKLPKEEIMGDFLSSMLIETISSKDPKLKGEVERKINKLNAEKNRKREEMEEQVIILQSKLIQVKRVLAQHGLLDEGPEPIFGNTFSPRDN